MPVTLQLPRLCVLVAAAATRRWRPIDTLDAILSHFRVNSHGRVLACFLAATASPVALGETHYLVTPLGAGTVTSGINAVGDVVGSVVLPSGRRAFLWSDGVPLLLGTLGGLDSHADGVNDGKDVAGYATNAGAETRAFLWRDGAMLDLGVLPGHTWSYAKGVSNLGAVVGTSGVDATGRAFLHDGHSMSDLGTLGGTNSSAFAVNDAGQVVGEADSPTHPRQAFLFSDGVMLDLGDKGTLDLNSGGAAINRAGHVAGYTNVLAGLGFATTMWLYANGQKNPVSCPYGRCFPAGINDADQIVGGAIDEHGNEIGAFLWERASGGIALSAAGWTIRSARAINNRGQIVAQGCNSQGCQGVRLDPFEPGSAIEYFHRGFGSYFVTADPAEIAALDGGVFTGWARTGQWFRVFELGAPGADGVCRFWSGQTFAPRSSHFYTPYAAECARLKQQGEWQYEGDVFALGLPVGPAGQGTCAPPSQPLYRAYNDGQGGMPNHRYTTDPAVLDAMIAQGWVMEGEESTRVFACVPP